MTKPTIRHFAINGIMTLPSDKGGWTDRFNAFVWKHGLGICMLLEYFAPFLMAWRSLKNQQMTRMLVQRIGEYRGDTIRLVGHSNGCDIICCAIGELLKSGRIKVDELHLIAGAVEHDFNKNFLNEALSSGLVRRVVIYTSKKDSVLSGLARPSRFLFGKLGYGYLGYQASVKPASLHIDSSLPAGAVQIIKHDDLGHSDWFNDTHFVWTGSLVTHGGNIYEAAQFMEGLENLKA